VPLALQQWGDPEAPAIVCVHGIQAHGRRFRRLAEERLVPAGFRVVAPDLRGHGHSTWDPPWSIGAQLAEAVELGESLGPVVWLGHSFGGRLVLELAAARPDLVTRAILLDAAVQMRAEEARAEADEERGDRSFADADAFFAARREAAPLVPDAFLEEELAQHVERGADGLLRMRYFPPAVITMWGELAAPPPVPPTCPTLVVVAEEADYTRPEHVAAFQTALGEDLTAITVPGDHIVLWDAYEATANAIAAFLAPS
jgi:lipase